MNPERCWGRLWKADPHLSWWLNYTTDSLRVQDLLSFVCLFVFHSVPINTIQHLFKYSKAIDVFFRQFQWLITALTKHLMWTKTDVGCGRQILVWSSMIPNSWSRAWCCSFSWMWVWLVSNPQNMAKVLGWMWFWVCDFAHTAGVLILLEAFPPL